MAQISCVGGTPPYARAACGRAFGSPGRLAVCLTPYGTPHTSVTSVTLAIAAAYRLASRSTGRYSRRGRREGFPLALTDIVEQELLATLDGSGPPGGSGPLRGIEGAPGCRPGPHHRLCHRPVR